MRIKTEAASVRRRLFFIAGAGNAAHRLLCHSLVLPELLAAMQGPRFENYVLSVLQMARTVFAGQYARPTPAIYQLPTNHLPSIYQVSTK